MDETMQSKALGLLLTAFSGICFACASLFVKLSGDLPIALVIMTRSMSQVLVVCFVNLFFFEQDLFPKDRKTLSLLSLFGVLSFLTVFGIYKAFQVIPLGEATVILSTCPIFVALLERCILKKPISPSDVLSAMVCCLGVSMMTHSSAGHSEGGVLLAGYLIVTMATIAQAATFIIVRHCNCHYVVPVFYVGFSNLILSTLLFIPQAYAMVLPDLLHSSHYLFLVSVFAVVGSFSLNHGLQYEQAAMVALLRNIDIVAAYIFDIFLFNVKFTPIACAGSLIVVSATVGSGFVSLMKSSQGYDNEDYDKLELVMEEDELGFKE